MKPSNAAGRGYSALKGSQNSITREPISIFQEIEKEADLSKKGNLQELLNKLRNLYPSELKVGAAVTKGDNFFDSIAQRLNELKNEGSVNYEGIFTVKSLRKDCADYASQNRGHAEFFAKLIDRKNAALNDYFVSQKDTSGQIMTVDRSIGDIQYNECVINEQETYQKYINDVQYPAKEIGNTARHAPIWGKSEIEGRMICCKYGIKLEVIELRGNGLDDPVRNEYGTGEKRITIVKYNAHFVPLLSSISQDVTRDQVNRQLPTKRKSAQQDGESSRPKRLRHDNQSINDGLHTLKGSIQILFDTQSDNVQKIIEQLYGYDPVQRVTNPFQKSLENHFVRYENPCGFFSMFYKKLSNPNNLPSLQDFATELAKLWIELLNNEEIKLQPEQISGTYNSLSKLSVLSETSSEIFKSLITGLADRAKGQSFNAQEIANIYNALSKFDILNTAVWNDSSTIQRLKTLITQLAAQAGGKDFNAREIANIYNALSKFDILNTAVWNDSSTIQRLKTLITQLAAQAGGKDFNARDIAMIYNALSKFDILNTAVWNDSSTIQRLKTLITNLANQAVITRNFNAQDIANIFNALSKFDILNTAVWNNNERKRFKDLITDLATQTQDKNFNPQHIGNILNALSKFDILNAVVWDDDTKRDLETHLGQLVVKAKNKDFNAQNIANIYNALSKWVDHDNINKYQDLIIQLAKKAPGKEFNPQEIANIFNALSKFDILNTAVWNNNEGKRFEDLITNLVTQALDKNFNPQDIANIFNALSKWLNADNISKFKPLITNLVTQALDKNFNPQEIANIFNALSKWVDGSNISEYQDLIKELAVQAGSKDFNPQEIANIFNALSKWVNGSNISEYQDLIKELAVQASGKDFNAQHIANIYNALSKWADGSNISEYQDLIKELVEQAQDKKFNTQGIAMIYNALSKWVDGGNISEYQDLIKELARQAQDKKFNAQAIANIYNALSKWNSIDEFKPLITQLAIQAVGKDFNAQHIANVYNALSKYPKSFIEENKTIFQDLVKNLAEKIINTEKLQKRDSASIIMYLPKLVEANLITDNYPLKDLLISLIKSFAHGEYQNEFVDSSRYFSEENYWTAVGIKGLAESIPRLNLSGDDKAELKRGFDGDIPKILNRISRFRLNSYRLVSVLEGVTKLISLGIIGNSADIMQPLNRLFENFKRYNDENQLTQEALEFFRSIPDQAVPARHIETDDLRLTPKNILAEDALESKRYNLPEDLERFIEEVLKPQEIEYISTPEARNLKGVFIAEVRALGRNQWGIYAREKIKAGSFLGIYDGERMSSEEAEKNRKNSTFLFDLSKFITIDASQLRNWAAFVNHAIIGIANIHSGSSRGKSKQIELRAYEDVLANCQLLLNYGNNYFVNLDYSPIYLHPTDNWKTPKEHYDENKVAYSDKVIPLSSEVTKAFGLKQEYIAATKLFQAVYSGQDLSVLLSSLSAKAIDLPSYSLELMSDKKWKFSEYDSQQNITPLMLACYLGKEAEVGLLLESGADPIRRTLHQGHNALFLTVLSDAESGIKENIFNKLIDHTYKALKKKSDAFYASKYEKPNNYDKLLLKDLSQFLQLTDASGSNIFDHMMDKGEYDLWKKYFDDSIKIDEISTKIHNREEKRKIAEKFISDKGILTIIASINGDKNYKEIVEILLENATGKFIEQHLQDLDQSGEIASYNLEVREKILKNLQDLDPKRKQGKITSIAKTLSLNETNKLKEGSKSPEEISKIKDGTKDLGITNKPNAEVRAIERLSTGGSSQSRTKRKIRLEAKENEDTLPLEGSTHKTKRAKRCQNLPPLHDVNDVIIEKPKTMGVSI